MAVKKNLAFFTLLIFIVLLFTIGKAFAGKTIDNRFNNLFLETNSINDIKHFLDNL